MANLTIYKGNKYYIEVYENKVDLYSINSNLYPNLKNINIKEVDYAYTERIWVKIRDCEALFNGIDDGFVLLDVRPSADVDILGAEEVDRGVFHAKLPITEIQEMWEERLPFLDFPFPKNVPNRVKLEIPIP